MKIVKVNEQYYLLSDEKFNQSIPKGTEYYDGKGNIRVWGTGNCFSTSSKNIIASTEKIEGRPLIDKEQIEFLLGKAYIEIKAFKELGITFIGEEDEKTYNDVQLYKTAYSQALQDNADKKFTLEDMEKCFGKGSNRGYAERACREDYNPLTGYEPKNNEQTFEEYIKSLKTEKTEWDAEIEMEKSGYVVSGGFIPEGEFGGKGLETHWSYKPKVNEQGCVVIKSMK